MRSQQKKEGKLDLGSYLLSVPESPGIALKVNLGLNILLPHSSSIKGSDAASLTASEE